MWRWIEPIVRRLRWTGHREAARRALAGPDGGDPDRAEEALRSALALVEEASAPADRERRLETLGELGSLVHGEGRLAEAVDHYETAVGEARRLDADTGSASDPRRLARLLNNLAAARLALGQRGHARPLLEEAVALHGQVAGSSEGPVDGPRVDAPVDVSAGSPVEDARARSAALNNLAQLERTEGDHGAALAHLEQAVSVLDDAVARGAEAGQLTAEHAAVAANLAEVLHARGRVAEAEGRYREALGLFERDATIDPELHAQCLEGYAALHRDAGRTDTARELEARATTLRRGGGAPGAGGPPGPPDRSGDVD